MIFISCAGEIARGCDAIIIAEDRAAAAICSHSHAIIRDRYRRCPRRHFSVNASGGAVSSCDLTCDRIRRLAGARFRHSCRNITTADIGPDSVSV
jgi:hypothetical protein